MTFEYSVTFDDFRDSMKGFRQISKGAAFAYYLDVLVLPLLGIALFLAWLIPFVRGDQDTASALSFLAIVGPLAIIVPPIVYALRVRQAYKQRTVLAEGSQVILHVDEQEVRFAIPGKADVRYPWTSFTSYSETERVGTLFVHRAAFHTIPKRCMSSEDWAQFRSLIDQKVGKS
jgi:hypothetical protein